MSSQPSERIEARETPVGNLFSENFFFNIPEYQRPFSWNIDNFVELYDDISNMIQNDSNQYFLGSILLQQKENKTYDVIDGQQRLTALTLLFAVIRDNTENTDLQNRISTSYIYQKEDPYKQIPEAMRITPWDELKNSFSKYVYAHNGTNQFLNDFDTVIKPTDKEDPLYHMWEAIDTFKSKITEQENIESFVKYILNNVYVVYITTTSRISAFRLFRVMNARGLPLTTSDLLKNENLESISNDENRKHYARIWRALEEDIGREELENVIGFIRTIKTKEKAKLSMYDEFEQIFKEKILIRGTSFIDYLQNSVEIYTEKILEKEVNLNDHDKNDYSVTMDLLQRFIPFSDWIPPIIAFHQKFNSDDKLLSLLKILEKKIVIEWILGLSSTERITRLNKIIKLIDETDKPDDVIQKIELPKGRNVETDFKSKLNDSMFYTTNGGKLAKFVLLRLDKELWELDNFPGYPGTITVEHILPRSVPPDSKWAEDFSPDERKRWVNRLGNLVLLSGRKNSKAQNYDFGNKKRIYFSKKDTPFKITQQLKDYKKWDLDTLKNRNDELITKSREIFFGKTNF